MVKVRLERGAMVQVRSMQLLQILFIILLSRKIDVRPDSLEIQDAMEVARPVALSNAIPKREVEVSDDGRWAEDVREGLGHDRRGWREVQGRSEEGEEEARGHWVMVRRRKTYKRWWCVPLYVGAQRS